MSKITTQQEFPYFYFLSFAMYDQRGGRWEFNGTGNGFYGVRNPIDNQMAIRSVEAALSEHNHNWKITLLGFQVVQGTPTQFIDLFQTVKDSDTEAVVTPIQFKRKK